MPFFKRREKKPADPPQPTSMSFSNIQHSAIATGSHNQQYVDSPVTTPPADPAALADAIAALRAVVETQVELSNAGRSDTAVGKADALARVDAIEAAAHADPPDGTKLAVAANWIKGALPAAAPAIARVIEHPTLDTVVTAAAQAIHDAAAHPAPKQAP